MKRYIRATAAEALTIEKESKNIVASQIALNIKGEWDAIEGYQKLIPFFKQYEDESAIADIEEIISDELNHAERLRKIIKRYDGGIKTAKD